MEQNTKMYKAKLIDGKLMLTSSDIQVGDKVKCAQTKDHFEEQDFNSDLIVLEEGDNVDIYGVKNTWVLRAEWWSDSVTITMPKNYCIKVIGEISPDATWVKEGDEFDEKKLAYNSDENEERLPVREGQVFLMGFDWSKPESDYKGYIYIKCPTCSNFH